MNHRSDIDRVLQIWMADGPAAIPDRVVDVVAARIGVQRQRRSWPFPGRTNVTTQIKLIAGLAAALVVAVVGFNLLESRPGPGLPSLAPATPTAAPTGAPTASLAATTKTTMIRPFSAAPDMIVTYALPRGWDLFGDWAVGPEGAEIIVVFEEADGIHGDPCSWDSAGTGDEAQPGDLAAGGDALEVATALHANPAYTAAGAPAPITIDSLAGYAIEIRLPAEFDLATCDVPGSDQDGQYLVFGGTAGGFYPQGPNNRWQISLVDVDDFQLAVIVSSLESTPAADMSAARSIVDSIQIGQ